MRGAKAKVSPETIREMHSLGLNDAEIASRLVGVHRSTVRSARIRAGLPAIPVGRPVQRNAAVIAAVRDYECGVSLKEIRARHNVHQQQVYRELRRQGKEPCSGTRLTPGDVQLAGEMYQRGVPWQAIADEIGIDYRYVSAVVRRAGVELNRAARSAS